MKVIAVLNQKGGSGKTTTAAALAGALREKHFVACLDLDPQACLGLLTTGVDNVDPSNVGQVLRTLAGQDFVIIDTPPALGPAVRVASELADGIVIPTRATLLDMRGLANLLQVIDTSKIIGLVVIAYRGHVRHHRRVLERLEGLGFPIVSRIPFTISVADAGLLGQSVTTYSAAKSRGAAAAYFELSEGIERWAKTG